ncbi:histidinol dehydrogenase [Candidatus Solirubrobacter pratensis]|uniref:histidinol dehydrogenase n=1 Tax=Candidatus Solirubrobacter pratensis TaxID=1298857 RepID=UPI00040FAD75|nr:histidinol dehydrogenase [Candidatus Solirubrobacter pratensis]
MAERWACTTGDAAELAARVRARVPAGESVAAAVAEIVAAVRERGDAAVREYEARFGGDARTIAADELDAALAALDPAVRAGLEVAIENVRAVAEAGLDEDAGAVLPQGQTVTLREIPVRRAAVYAPSGRNPYPSSVVMGAVTARAAGVDEVYLATAPHPVILAAARLCGVDAVHGVTGAQAIAAFAYGTETIPKADVIVGPGSLYVQEAKRQVFGDVGIDGFNGPSDLTVIASAGADTEALALDLAAQAEHGEGSLTVAVSDSPQILDALPGLTIHAESLDAALAFAEALAPEHLQLAGDKAEALAPRIRSAGCLFVGNASGTAFGDYVAGSNHTLPTEGAARFASGLNVRHFRRRMAEVRLGAAAPALARAGVPIAEAEGFAAHAASMALRLRGRSRLTP